MGPDGRQHAKTFATKKEAVEWEARQRAALADRAFVAPRTSATPISEVARRWMAAENKQASSVMRDESSVRNHILPGLGPARAVSSVTKADCQGLVDGWVRGEAAPGTVVRQAAVMRSMFQCAVDAELVDRNPAARLRLPRVPAICRSQLLSEELERLAAALGPEQGLMMWCGVVLGLRWAEAAGLTVESIDLSGGAALGDLKVLKAKGREANWPSHWLVKLAS